MLRSAILAAAGSGRVKRAVTRAPVSRSVVRRFVAGESLGDAVVACRMLRATGMAASLDRLGEDTLDVGQAEVTVKAYLGLLDRLAVEGLSAGGAVEVSVKLTSLGQRLDPALAIENAGRVCAAARAAGTTVTLDMEGSATTDATLGAITALRPDFPTVGAVIQAMLRRSEDDCRSLVAEGSRVRLCKGAYAEPEDHAFVSRAEVDASYARCLGVLMAGQGFPMVATHDPRLIDLAQRLAARTGRTGDTFEYQMLFGIRPDEQRRLVASGARMRIYVPYGDEWYGYLMRRLAERPANLAFFLRSVATRS